MDKELYIDGHLMDLGEKTVIAITYQVNDVGSLDNRQANRSNQFTLPYTLNNDLFFGVARRVESTSLKPYRKNGIKYVEQGITIISGGFAVVSQASDGYKVTVYSGNIDFFEAIKGLKLRDLDFSEYNHLWNFYNVINSRTNTEGFIYPVIYHKGVVGEDVVEDYGIVYSHFFFPSTFVQTIVKKIVEAQGWTLTGSVLENPMYKKMILPFVNDKFANSESFYTNAFNTTAIEDQVFDNSARVLTGGYYKCKSKISLETSGHVALSKFTAPFSGSYEFSINMELAATVYGGTVGGNDNVMLFLYDSTAGLVFDGSFHEIALPNGFTSASYNVSKVKVHGFTAGHTYELYIESMSTAGTRNWRYSLYNLKTRIHRFEIATGETVNLSDQLPDMNQTDFLKAIMNLFCISPSTKDNVLKFNVFSDLDKMKAKNMSSKVTGQSPSIEFRGGDYAQKNNFKYLHESEESINGDSYFSVDDETLSLEKDLITSIFQDTEMMNGLGSQLIPFINILQDAVLNDLIGGSGKYWTGLKAVTPRILMLRPETYELNYIDIYGTDDETITTNVPFCHFRIAGRSDNLDWVNLLSLNYKEIIQSLNQYKKVNDLFRLTPYDVQDFDHFILWYIEKYSAYFYVNKIKDYKNGFLTNVELIRL